MHEHNCDSTLSTPLTYTIERDSFLLYDGIDDYCDHCFHLNIISFSSYIFIFIYHDTLCFVEVTRIYLYTENMKPIKNIIFFSILDFDIYSSKKMLF